MITSWHAGMVRRELHRSERGCEASVVTYPEEGISRSGLNEQRKETERARGAGSVRQSLPEEPAVYPVHYVRETREMEVGHGRTMPCNL